jgi:tetratricopeptide (TPR) repeat protein
MKHSFLLFSLLFTALMAETNATYVGDQSCKACHAREFDQWKGSDHALAMMEANATSVRGDFNDVSFNYNGIVSKFYTKEGKFMVRTDGEDGKLHDYEIAYTFGVYPLQQYMVKFPKGRVQVLDIAWDSRGKEEGGQRWFHIHKDDNVTAGDPLHWTGPNLNWNYMCADCHSTNLKKNYDAKTRSYHTTWDVINVSCEACHGPASEHIVWTKTKAKKLLHHGFPLSLQYKKGRWDVNTTTLKSEINRQEVEVCAKCHSRRTQLDDDFKAGDKFHEHYLPVTIDDGLYFPDGKIEDEVYVYNSFLQSKMYAKGVTCSDCHNPHTLNRRAEGDKVCFQCHKEQKYTAKKHHFHKEGSSGASCVNCHMPPRTYMGVDNRNDHSFRIPRPDISVEMPQVPNACNICHQDQNASWAAASVKKWYGKIPVGKQHFAHALHSLRNNLEGAPKQLYSVLTSNSPTLAKATVTGYLGNYPTRQTYTTALQMLRRPDVMTRRKALEALEAFPPKIRIKEVFKALEDPAKIVRTEAARQLTAFPEGQLDEKSKHLLKKALKEYEETLLFTAERPESQLSLGMFYLNQGEPEKAENAYREALLLQPKFVPAYVNYSNFLMQQGRNKEAFELLQKGMKEVPDMAILHHALGLWYVRQKQKAKALPELKKAVMLDSNDARFAYVYAVALGEKDAKAAVAVLERVYPRHTGSVELVSALAYYSKMANEPEKAKQYEEKLKALQNFSVR